MVKRQPPENYLLTPDNKERRELLIWALIIISISFVAVIVFIY